MAILQWWRTASYQKQHSNCDSDQRDQLVTLCCKHCSGASSMLVMLLITIPAIDDLSI